MHASPTDFGPQLLVCDYCGAEVLVPVGGRPSDFGWLQFAGYLPEAWHACPTCLSTIERVANDSRASGNPYTAAAIEAAPFTGATPGR